MDPLDWCFLEDDTQAVLVGDAGEGGLGDLDQLGAVGEVDDPAK